MKRQIRYGVFESNSSSQHSIAICSEKEFNAWKKGEVLFDEYDEKFVHINKLSEKDKKEAELQYKKNKDEYYKDWKDLSEEAKQRYYKKYQKRKWTY